MCFLLNGRKRDKSTEYSCGFFPKKIHTMAHGKPGRPGIDIEFNGVSVHWDNNVCVTIDYKNIWIKEDGSEFVNADSTKNAKSIFGVKANPNIVMIEAKWALSEILQDFKKEIDTALERNLVCGVIHTALVEKSK